MVLKRPSPREAPLYCLSKYRFYLLSEQGNKLSRFTHVGPANNGHQGVSGRGGSGHMQISGGGRQGQALRRPMPAALLSPSGARGHFSVLFRGEGLIPGFIGEAFPLHVAVQGFIPELLRSLALGEVGVLHLDVRVDADFMDGLAAGGVIQGRGQAQGRTVPQGQDGLHRALAETLGAHDDGPLLVFQAPRPRSPRRRRCPR